MILSWSITVTLFVGSVFVKWLLTITKKMDCSKGERKGTEGFRNVTINYYYIRNATEQVLEDYS